MVNGIIKMLQKYILRCDDDDYMILIGLGHNWRMMISRLFHLNVINFKIDNVFPLDTF